MRDSDDDQAMCANAAAFANDDDDDVAAAVLAAEHYLGLLVHMIDDFDTRRGRSLPGNAPNKQRDFVSEERGLMRDYSGVEWIRRSMMRKASPAVFVFPALFLTVCTVPCRPSCTYFQQRLNATVQPLEASTLQKMTAALRVLAFGVAYDSMSEYVRWSESTVCKTVHHFAHFVVDKYHPVYLRQPTLPDLQRILSDYEQAGFPGCMKCVDCSHCVWKKCPISLHGQYQGRSLKRSIVMDTVADKDLYLWHLYIGLPAKLVQQRLNVPCKQTEKRTEKKL